HVTGVQTCALPIFAHTGTFDKSELVRHAADEPVAEPCDINDQTPAKRADMEKWSRVFAVVTPLAVVAIILIMVLPSIFPSLPALRGGEAAGLVGGVAFILMMSATAAACGC